MIVELGKSGQAGLGRRWGFQRFALGAFLLVALRVIANEANDKSHFHLFHPTPREQMREMSTDRPDQTESPYTVDAGHVQVEMDLVNYTHDRDSGVTAESLTIAPINFKLGLLNNVDVQFVVDSYVCEKTKTAPFPSTKAQGTGDLQTRLKVNLWGNDGGETAFAVMPFIKWPTASSALSNGKVEGGVILPLGISLGERFGLGLMTEVDFLRDPVGGGDQLDYVNSITLSCDVTEQLGLYVEFFSVVSEATGSDLVGQFDLGATFGLTPDVQLDAGVNIGVTESAPDWQPFAGLTIRF